MKFVKAFNTYQNKVEFILPSMMINMLVLNNNKRKIP